jgi:molybdate transport system substrate-binding protein
MKKLAVGVSAALLMSYSFAAHATTTISVGVAANFAGALAAVISNFEADYPSYSVTYTSASTGTLTTNIINGGGSGPYDLFLAADTSAPAYLVNHYSTYVVGSSFHYAQGYLTLWSSTKNEINVSSGLPSSFTSLIIGDPSSGSYGYNVPYGHAAAQVLYNVYGISLPYSGISTASSIGATYSDVDSGSYQMGFVAKSQTGTCGTGAYTPNADTYTYYNYAPGSTTYDAIIQDGIKIAKTRTSDQETELTTFVSYLSNSSSQNVIESLCYTIP